MQDLHYFYNVFYKKHTIILKRQDHHSKYIKFREQYAYFRFVSYSFELNNKNLDIKFTFDLSGKYTFKPTLKLLHRGFYDLNKIPADVLSNIVFHIGMIELISYWKLSCSPTLIIEAHHLSQEQIDWWKKLYYNGLGEFFYLNGIKPDPDNFIQFQTKGKKLTLAKRPLSDEKVLVPVGGGKDSIVTLKLLKDSGFELFPMMLNPREASVRTIELAGYDISQSVVVERTLDTTMLDLNSKGFLNGHTPFSALLAFLNVLPALATGSKYIALSNENSANESTVPDTDINHQYSKSFEFEKDFADYSRKYLHPKLEYFSFLRPLNELQIAKLFSSFPVHFKSFRSCNVGSKEDKWCGKCPKCLFTYIILSPFISKEEMNNIFTRDLLDDNELKTIFEELTGALPVKPFECVGTPDEINAAIDVSFSKLEVKNLPVLIRNHHINTNGKKTFTETLRSFNFENLLPPLFLKILLNHISLSVDEQFQIYIKSKFGVNPELLILGFGKEGQSTYKLIRKYYPETLIHIADANESIKDLELVGGDKNLVFSLGKTYQNRLSHFTIIIKSPGVQIDKEINHKHLYSQTNLFLDFFRDKTIGVTGTKGKSTTSSLIHHLLINSGKKSKLLGNIGVPPFNMIHEIEDDTIIVFEMSAHQLEYVNHSPHVGVLLNVFPEHLDYFKSLKEYQEAKYNILRFQKNIDYAITQDTFSDEVNSHSLLFGSKSSDQLSVYYDDNELVFPSENRKLIINADQLALRGQHNMLNIIAAMLAVSCVGVDFDESIKHLKLFKPLPHRLEFVGSFEGIDFYNDSISTVPESTTAAVQTLKQVKTLILGGYDRGLEYVDLVKFLNKSEVEHFLFLGKAGDTMFNIFKQIHSMNNLVKVKTIEEAVKYAMQHTGTGICLLSPAAASYDQFHNFEHRGDSYKESIEKYAHKKSG